MEIKVSKSIMSWYASGGCEKIERFMLDSDGIFSSNNGFLQGVYGAYVVTPEGREILMYIGDVGKGGRGFRDRLTEHAKYWLENPEFYTGLKMSDLINGYKYKIKILAIEQDANVRYKKKQNIIEEGKPYLQYNCYPKFKSDEYRGYDIAILGSYRRRAYVVARDGKYTEDEEKNELFVDNIYSLRNVDFNDYRSAKPNRTVVELVKKEMSNGSEVWRKVKDLVETNMGITSKRGCQYSYLVRIVAAALEPTYKTMAF